MTMVGAPPLTGRRLWVALLAVFLLVVLSVVPWRRGAIFDGGVDTVVIAKAIISFLAFGLALAVRAASAHRGVVGLRSLALLAGITAVSALGAIGAGDPMPSLVLTVRIVIVAATVVVLVAAAPPRTALMTLLAAMGAVAVFSGLTGAIIGGSDRLAGGIPEMAPNVLAGLAGPPLIAVALDLASRGIRWSSGSAFAALLAIVLATGSRTSLAVVLVGILLVLLHVRRLPASVMIVAIASVPAVFALFAFNDTVARSLSRGQSIDELATLSSRTVAWEAALATPFDTWDKWIGIGLAAKLVPVQERWRDEQVLDSSWVSIIAQAGIIGTALLLAWVVATVADSIRRRDLAMLTTPLLAVILIRSFTENGLIESSSTFLLFLAIALTLEPGSRNPAPPRHGSYRLAIAPQAFQHEPAKQYRH
jgi:hypothetical protein